MKNILKGTWSFNHGQKEPERTRRPGRAMLESPAWHAGVYMLGLMTEDKLQVSAIRVKAGPLNEPRRWNSENVQSVD